MLGSGCRTVIYVDHKRAAELSQSEKVELYIPAGEHILASGPTGNGLCGMGDAEESMKRPITISVKPNHTSIYRVAMLSTGATLMPTTL
jgi:hypothetical protein